MRIAIKFTNLLSGYLIRASFRKRAVLAAFMLIGTVAFVTSYKWQVTVSGQELFGLPNLDLPFANIAVSPSEGNNKPANMNIAYLSRDKDPQLSGKVDDLISKAGVQGPVRVIIGFQFDFKLDGDLTESLIADQRTEIKRAQEAILQKVDSFGAKNIKQFGTIPYVAMTVDGTTLDYLRSLPEITSIVEDTLAAPTLAQSVPLVGAPTAWSNGYSGSGWNVAILDTGVNKAHPFLTGKVISEACYSTTGTDFDTSSVCPGGASQSTALGSGYNCSILITGCDHGTHVAGIAAGTNPTFSGVAKSAGIISIQVFSKQNSSCSPDPNPCTRSYASDQVLGLERVMLLRNSFAIAAVNMSLGSTAGYPSTCDAEDPAITTAITNLRSVDIATVISSGNRGLTSYISFPACISTAISVGSTGDGSGGWTVDKVSSFSNSSSILKLLAPGSSINSSVPGDGYPDFSGTSMAAPHVAGAWAILKQRSPNASVNTVLNALTVTGLPITDSRNNLIQPRIRVDGALRRISGGTCGYSFPSGPGFTYGRGGGSATFFVDATESDCSWTATSNSPSSLTITSGTSGVGDGVVGYSVAANTTAFTRTGTISVGGQTFTITQLGDCVTAISPTSQSVGISGLNSSITVTATSGCVWTAQENVSWITFVGQSSGTGSGTFGYSVAANTSGAYRAANIFVGGKVMTVTQSGSFTNCPLSTQIAFGQTINGSLTASDCNIAGQSTRYVDPYYFTGTAGQRVALTMRGSGSFLALLYLFAPNGEVTTTDSSGTSRLPTAMGSFFTLPVSGFYTVYATTSGGGVGTYSLILNDELTCGSSSISPSSQSFNAAGGSGSLELFINSGCAWETSRNYGWLTLTSGIAGTGNGTVNYTVAANSTGASRTQTISVNGLPFVVTQSRQPTAASVSIAGRVLAPTGNGVSGAALNLVYQNGETRTAYTNPFGYYRFDDVVVGQTVVVSVVSKRHEFAPQLLSVTEELNDMNFSAIMIGSAKWNEPTKVNLVKPKSWFTFDENPFDD